MEESYEVFFPCGFRLVHKHKSLFFRSKFFPKKLGEMKCPIHGENCKKEV